MKDILGRFSLFRSDGMRFTDVLCDFTRDSSTVSLDNTEYMYIGFRSRFYSFYVYGDTYNTADSIISLEYFDGVDWQELTQEHIADDTLGLSRAGFISYNFDDSSDWRETTHQDIKQYWLRVSVDVSTSSMELKAINCLFSDDSDIINMYPPLTRVDFKLGEDDYIKKHVSVRDEIVQEFRNKGLIINPGVLRDKYLRVVAQDLLDFQEVRIAARHLALSKIFWDISDNPDDSWAVKAEKHKSAFDKFLNLAYLSFDPSGTGEKETNMSYIKVARLHR